MLGGMGDGQAPGELLAGNIAAAMARRRLGHADVAERMQALGYKWIRQTVGDVLSGRRSLRAAELYGVAVALDIPITTLVVPWADSVSAGVTLPSGVILEFSTQFQIRDVPSAAIMWTGNKPQFARGDTLAYREAGE
jgi:hypothetical protein